MSAVLALVVALLAAGVGGYFVWNALDSSDAFAAKRREAHPQARWAQCNRNAGNGRPSSFRPLADGAAAALVTPEPETRPDNAKAYSVAGAGRFPSANTYVPTGAQIARFRRSRLPSGQTAVRFNPYLRYVDGRDGFRHPSTDELIQWAAHKWGIPEDWLRAEYVVESYWNVFQLGDEASVSAAWYQRYPPQARVPGSLKVYESLGITQVKWIPNNSIGPGTEPLRWESTAFNIDYQAATVRFFYDNPEGSRSSWGDASYAPCEAWESIGGWYESYPWQNGLQAQYIAKVRNVLREHEWARSDFVDWSPGSLPPGVKLR